MAINNVYNQTPKRIYTNKPFVKGMNYTNADMGEYVCRAVANLDLESSNTATKLRSGTKNEYVAESKMVKFYSKIVLFENTISEDEYVNNRLPATLDPTVNRLGVRLLTEASKAENTFYEKIIRSDSVINWDGNNLSVDYTVINTDMCSIFALSLNDGTIPHLIYGNDYSLVFFGLITYGTNIAHRGMIKIYFHAAMQQAIIEIPKPTVIDPLDVNSYGSNLTLNNPLLFRDYVYFITSGKDYYSQYGLTSEAADKSITDILTTMIYDAPVTYNSYMVLTSGATANVIKGVDRTVNGTIYVRPYCVIPRGEFGFIVKAKTSTGALYYNFETNHFEDITTREDYTEPDEQATMINIYREMVHRIDIYNDTSSLNIPISTNAFADEPLDEAGSISLEINLINLAVVKDDKYRTYYKNNMVTSNTAYINTYKYEIIKYDSSKENNNPLQATRITSHLGHYVLYGDYIGRNALYYSAFADIAYFPSMYVIEFNSPIVYVHTHQNNLVVFTEDDIYLLYNGNVPSTTVDDGNEVPFTVTLIQSNVRLGKDNINTVRSIGKDVFFISNTNVGYLLKSNKYVNDASDTYLVPLTNAIGDLLKDPFEYALERYKCYFSNFVEPPRLEPFSLAFTKYANKITVPSECQSILLDGSYEVVDGDTIYTLDSSGNRLQGYRLAYINTPEVNFNNEGKSERLAIIARDALVHYINSLYNPTLYYFEGEEDEYGRIICYLIDGNLTRCINFEMVNSGLAKVAFKNANTKAIMFDMTPLADVIDTAEESAKYYHRGLYNNTEYSGLNTATNTIEGYSKNYAKLFVHTNNSNIYIIQSIVLANEAAMTIIYKYNIDSRVWITYDVPYPLFPTESASDYSYEGFKMYCNNTYKVSQTLSSIFSFVNNKITDDTQIAFNMYPTTIVNVKGVAISTMRWMNVYFDTGNQSLNIMNEKLFREFKLSLGTTSDKELDIDYGIKFYVDEKPITPNNHYYGSQETYEGGYKKITFFTPARGRIPRFTFSADCRSDLNILQYAIVYLQLNAK